MAAVAAVRKDLAPQNPVPSHQERARITARVASLKSALRAQEPVLRDIQQYLCPFRGRFQKQGQDQRGSRRGLKVVNGTATRSFKILSSGMMAGLTSPGRPWFRLTVRDADLAEFTPVRQWLDDVARAMRATFARSNLYNVLPSVYNELAPFGTAALLEVDDPEAGIRFYPHTIGTYGIAQDDRLVVDTFAREYKATIRQLIGRFGTENLSQTALNMWRQNKLEAEVDCIHIIRPNLGMEPDKFGWRSMPFIEEYWEASSDRDEPLGKSGYHEQALFVPRWDVAGDDLWGTGLGHEVLGDVKQLQFLERRKEDVLDKHTAPPLEAGVELRGKRVSLLSGDVTYTNPNQTGGASIRPIVTTNPAAYQYAAQNINEIEARIRSSCYEDLFLMLANDTRSGITAREVEERHQEKLLVLGPVLERLNEELLDPIISRTYGILERQSRGFWRGMIEGEPVLPPPPPDIEGEEIQVEYTSILAQAAKATHTRGLEAFGMFIGSVAQARLAAQQAGVDEKVDWDQLLDEYADAQGIPARVMNDDDTVASLRGQKAQQEQMQQMAQMAGPMKDAASAMKDAAETVPKDGSLAANLAAGMGGVGLPGGPGG